MKFAPITENLVIPDNYYLNFRLAEFTFLHQHVFDPRIQKMVPLTPLDLENETKEFADAVMAHIGPYLNNLYFIT